MTATDLLISSDSHVQVEPRRDQGTSSVEVPRRVRPCCRGLRAAHDGWRCRREPGLGNEASEEGRAKSEAVQEQRAARISRRCGSAGRHGPRRRAGRGDLQRGRASSATGADLKESQHDTTVAFNEVLRDFAAADPTRLVVSYQIPIHDIDGAIAEVQRVAGARREVVAAAGVPARARAARLLRRALRPAVRGDPGDRPADLLPHRAEHRARRPGAARPDAGQAPSWCRWRCSAPARRSGMWIMGGVFERFPDLKVVFVEPGVGWVAWWLYIVDDMVLRQGYECPAITELPSHYFHRNVFLTFIDEPDALGSTRSATRSASRTSCGRATTRIRCRAGPNSRKIAAQCVAGLPGRGTRADHVGQRTADLEPLTSNGRRCPLRHPTTVSRRRVLLGCSRRGTSGHPGCARLQHAAPSSDTDVWQPAARWPGTPPTLAAAGGSCRGSRRCTRTVPTTNRAS